MTSAPLRLYMAMSLDGFVAGPDDRPGQELGRNGGRVMNWLDERHGTGADAQVYQEAMATGAVVSGRRTFELAGRWNGDHHDGVPILILTHSPEPPAGRISFFDDVHALAAEARRRSGGKPVLVHGAAAAQALLAAGELDELEIHLTPVLLGAGRRLFGRLRDQIELELVRRLNGHDAIHLRYRVSGSA